MFHTCEIKTKIQSPALKTGPHAIKRENVWVTCREIKIQYHQCHKLTLFQHAHQVQEMKFLNSVY